MRNRKSHRIKKTFTILLMLCFLLSVTAASASSAGNSKNNDGHRNGYEKGYTEGKKQGQKDCNQYGSRDTLSKIPSPSNDDRWTKDYKDSYNQGFKRGYIDGYNGNRYSCLR